MFVLFEPRILLLGIDLTEIISGTDQDLCTRKLITGLFITWEKNWKQPNPPTGQEGRNELQILGTSMKQTRQQALKTMVLVDALKHKITLTIQFWMKTRQTVYKCHPNLIFKCIF